MQLKNTTIMFGASTTQESLPKSNLGTTGVLSSSSAPSSARFVYHQNNGFSELIVLIKIDKEVHDVVAEITDVPNFIKIKTL